MRKFEPRVSNFSFDSSQCKHQNVYQYKPGRKFVLHDASLNMTLWARLYWQDIHVYSSLLVRLAYSTSNPIPAYKNIQFIPETWESVWISQVHRVNWEHSTEKAILFQQQEFRYIMHWLIHCARKQNSLETPGLRANHNSSWVNSQTKKLRNQTSLLAQVQKRFPKTFTRQHRPAQFKIIIVAQCHQKELGWTALFH